MRQWGIVDQLDVTKLLQKRPSEHNGVEFGPDCLQQLRVEEVLTQAEGAPVASAHAAQPGVAEEKHTPTRRL